MIRLLIAAVLTLISVAAQDNKICALVTAEDATSVLGSPAKQTKDPSGCGWEDATHKRHLNIAYVNVASMFERARASSAGKGKTQDETGLGGPAFSTIPTADNGNRAAIYCLKGPVVLILDLEAIGAADRLPQMREAMRKLASKM